MTSDLSRKAHDTIESIQAKLEKYGLVVVKADKGNTVVIMRREIYVKKMMDILSDDSKALNQFMNFVSSTTRLFSICEVCQLSALTRNLCTH